MNAASVQLKLDREHDVLYARRADARIRTSTTRADDYLILNLDENGNVVGVQLTAAHEMPADFWSRHPDRDALPADLLDALDRWMVGER